MSAALYPSQAYPQLVQEALLGLSHETQAPVEMTALSFLAAISAAAHAVYDIQLPTGSISPLTLFSISIAESGDRKTTLSNRVWAAHNAEDQARRDRFEKALKEWGAKHRIWGARVNSLERAIAKSKADSAEMTAHCAKLEALVMEEPAKPQEKSFMLQNATLPAILLRLHERKVAQALVSDEGGQLTEGPALRELPALNAMWSKQIYAVERVPGKSFVLRDARLSLDVMLQPSVAKKFVQTRGEEAMGSGFFARCLFAYPTSWRGFRIQTEPSAAVQAALEKFHNRIRQLLGRPEALEGKPRVVLELTPGAAYAWRDFSAWAESLQRPGAAWAQLPSFASKAAEQAARIAGNFHVIEHDDGLISEATLRQAIEVTVWHINEAVRVLCQQSISEPMMDLQAVYNWAWERCSRTQQVEYAVSDLLRFVPHKLRKKALLIPILNNIVAQGLGMWTTQNPKRPAFTFWMMPTPLHYQVDSNVLA